MNGPRASNFKRIHLGLLLDLVLMFLLPAILAALLAVVAGEAVAAGIEEATAETLLRSPTLAIRALYSLLALQYCLSALCALLVVSGIGETGYRKLRRAKRDYMALTIMEALAMLAHITDVLLPGDGFRLVSIAFVAAILLVLILRWAGLRSLLLGFCEVLRSIGSQERSARALARHLTAAFALILGFLLAVVVSAVLGERGARMLLLGGFIVALVYYAVVYILTAHCARKTADVIAAISE
jgi:hypothetical protein